MLTHSRPKYCYRHRYNIDARSHVDFDSNFIPIGFFSKGFFGVLSNGTYGFFSNGFNVFCANSFTSFIVPTMSSNVANDLPICFVYDLPIRSNTCFDSHSRRAMRTLLLGVGLACIIEIRARNVLYLETSVLLHIDHHASTIRMSMVNSNQLYLAKCKLNQHPIDNSKQVRMRATPFCSDTTNCVSNVNWAPANNMNTKSELPSIVFAPTWQK